MITVKKLKVKIGDNQIIKDISFTTNPGELIFLMGKNASGKTTLLNTIMGVIPELIDAELQGEIILNKIIQKCTLKDKSKLISFVSQDPESQFFTSTVKEELELNQINPSDVFHYTNLTKKHLDKDPQTLSHGEKKALALALTLKKEKTTILLDEPTNGIDKENKEIVYEKIKKLSKNNKTIITIEHDIRLAEKYADKILILDDGKTAYYGKPEGIINENEKLIQFGIEPKNLLKQMYLGKNPTEKNILDVNKLSYSHNDQIILKELSFQIKNKDIIHIKGPTGAGKTTLLKNIICLLTPSSGVINYAGETIENLSQKEIAKNIGITFQNPTHQIFNTTVKKELAFGLKTLKLYEGETQVTNAAEKFNILHLLDRNPHTLSHGEKHRLTLASTWITQPKIILLDEPELGFDFFGKKKLFETIINLQKEGRAIVIVSHSDMFENIKTQEILVEKCSS